MSHAARAKFHEVVITALGSLLCWLAMQMNATMKELSANVQNLNERVAVVIERTENLGRRVDTLETKNGKR